MNSLELPIISAGSVGILAVVYGAFVYLVHIIMALAVNGDAKRLLQNQRGLFLFGPFLWGWIVFIFGLPGLAAYWAIHHSTLRNSKQPNQQ